MSDVDQATEATEGRDVDTLLEGLVAQVLNERELVINIGREAGVRKGMRFAVLAQTPVVIKDPADPNRDLGVLDNEKVRVEAVQVLPLLTVCRTYRYTERGGSAFWGGSLLQEMINPPRKTYDTFNATESAFPKPLTEEESYVKIKDRVKQIATS